jgi:hypothetical protein
MSNESAEKEKQVASGTPVTMASPLHEGPTQRPNSTDGSVVTASMEKFVLPSTKSLRAKTRAAGDVFSVGAALPKGRNTAKTSGSNDLDINMMMRITCLCF